MIQLSANSLLDVYLNKAIPQNLLLLEGEFERYASERGEDIRREDLEFLEELGLLFPLCRLKLPLVDEYRVKGEVRKRYAAIFDISHTLSKWCEERLCEDPTKTKFRPWKEYRDGYHETARALYHPWQFMTLRTIIHWLGHRISVPQILEEEKLARIAENVQKFWGSQQEWKDFIVRRVARDSRFFPLLISIEDVYLPLIRNHFKGNIREPEIGFQVWHKFRSRFNHAEALGKSGVTVKDIENWRTQIAVEARHLDPLRDWYLLVRHATYSKRQKLRGDALFAQDCYEIIEILGLFLEDLIGKPQYGPDDLIDGRHGEWKKRLYGAEVDFANRDVLRKIVYTYGLDYDYKMLLFVEGDTEFHAIPIIANEMDISFARLGIRLEKLGGYSEIAPRRIEKLLQYANRDKMMAYIIIDNHENSKRYVDQLVVRKDLPVENDRVRIWDVDFEEDNFSIDELLKAATQVAARKEVTINLTDSMIEEKRKDAPKMGIGEILVALCEEQRFNLSKADLGEELGLMVAERIKSGKSRTSKIEDELIRIVQKMR